MKEFLEEKSLDKLESAVEEIEKSTSAEIVVTIAKFSGSYRDISMLWGFIFAVFILVLVLIIPWEIHYILVVPGTIFAFIAGYFLSGFTPFFVNLLAGSHRKKENVRQGAKIAFFDENVSATKDRTGILFYISLLEEEVEILTDIGIDGKITRNNWNSLAGELSTSIKRREGVEKFTERIVSCIKVLSSGFPRAEDDVDEIPNRPRVI